MPDEQFKRNIAYKLRIGDILRGKPRIEAERFKFLELGDKNVVRINLVGNIVDKYESEGEKQYCFLTLDDGSGQIKVKAFGEDMKPLKDLTQGQTIVIIGTLRNWNNETYIQPEIIKNLPTEYLLVRKLELEKNNPLPQTPLQREHIIALKDNLLDLIKKAEEQGGIEKDEIIMQLKSSSPEIINQEIKKLLEEGIIFEPRPGKLRWLG